MIMLQLTAFTLLLFIYLVVYFIIIFTIFSYLFSYEMNDHQNKSVLFEYQAQEI